MRREIGAPFAGILVLMLAACLDTPTPLTATVSVQATQSDVVGGKAQLVVKVTNTGPAIKNLGLVFMTSDTWYERHTVSDAGGCSVAPDFAAFACGDLAQGATASYVIVGIAKSAGTFHFELALRELVHPFAYVNDHSDGADVQTWDETIKAA